MLPDLTKPATIPISRYYEGLDPGRNALIDVSLMGSIYNGILNAGGPSSAISPTCSTGNCTYTTQYTSLGFCSSCQNITPTLSKSFVNVTLIDPISGEQFSVLQLNISLPNGLSLLQGSVLTIQPEPVMGIAAGTGSLGGFGDGSWLIPYHSLSSLSNQSLAIATSTMAYGSSGVFVPAANQPSQPFLGIWSISETRDTACSRFSTIILYLSFSFLPTIWH